MFLVPSSENSHMPSTDVALDSIQHPNPSFNTEVYMIICMLAFLILTILAKDTYSGVHSKSLSAFSFMNSMVNIKNASMHMIIYTSVLKDFGC